MRSIAVACAVASLLVLAAVPIVGGLAYPGYDHLTQYISELGATGTPTGRAASLAMIVSGALLTTFWVLCAVLTPRSGLAVAGFGLSALNGLGLLFSGVFPCDFRCLMDDPSPSQMLHDVFGGFGYLFGIVGVFLVGVASRRWPSARHLFSLSLLCGIPAALAIWLIAPEFPWHGVAQRVVEIALAVWTLAVALHIRRRPSERPA